VDDPAEEFRVPQTVQLAPSVETAQSARTAVPADAGTTPVTPVRGAGQSRPHLVSTADARRISKTLFARMATLEEGTQEHTDVRNTLVELNMTLVKFAAARYRTRDEPLEDILQVGTIGLIKAINRFDPDRAIEFPTFALPTIVGEIKRFFRDTSWAVHVPRRLQELRLHLARATADLAQALDRPPTVAELAARLRLTREEVTEGLIAANGYTTNSLDRLADETGEGSTLFERLGHIDPGLDCIDNVTSLKPLIAQLTDRERSVLSLRFTGDLTQSQIGSELGISQMHVSRILTRALGRLRTPLLDEE
jgi:RNA polymerase sigma-B factor